MMETKTMLPCATIHDGLAWAMESACQKLDAGKVYEVRYNGEQERSIGWHQVEDTLPILGACAPHQPDGQRHQLLGRFKVQ